MTLTAALLVFPGSAAASDSDPVVSGDCGATVRGGDGDPLSVDAGALLNSPGSLEIGLGSRSESELSIPVEDTIEGLGLHRTGPVSSTVEEVCDTGQGAVNAVTEPVRGTVPDTPTTENTRPSELLNGDTPSTEKNAPSTPGSEVPVADDMSADDTGGRDSAGPDGSAGPGGGVVLFPTGGAGSPDHGAVTPRDQAEGAPENGSRLAMPPATTVAPDEAAHATATEADTMELAPLLLAVAGLVGVGTSLAHTWVRRRQDLHA